MGRTTIAEYEWLIAQAFEGDDEHSLMANLASLADEEWGRTPGLAQRSVAGIVAHVAAAKHAYAESALGRGRRTFAEALHHAPRERDALVAWLRQGHERLLALLAPLDDDALASPRPTHWGEQIPLRRVLAVLVEHDLYHAGEINHLRALLQGDDEWPGARD